jgi:hypothetical protein
MREAVWKEHFRYDIIEQQMRDLKIPFQSLCEKKRLDRQTEIELARPDPDSEADS